VTDAQVASAIAFRARLRATLHAMRGADGVTVLPTMPDVAPLLSSDEGQLGVYRNQAIRLLLIAGMAGLPQLSMPLATRLGAPLGPSLIGPAGSDRSLVALAEAICGRARPRRLTFPL
jgi:amidase